MARRHGRAPRGERWKTTMLSGRAAPARHRRAHGDRRPDGWRRLPMDTVGRCYARDRRWRCEMEGHYVLDKHSHRGIESEVAGTDSCARTAIGVPMTTKRGSGSSGGGTVGRGGGGSGGSSGRPSSTPSRPSTNTTTRTGTSTNANTGRNGPGGSPPVTKGKGK